jgi:outer membrane lipoprotein LolB
VALDATVAVSSRRGGALARLASSNRRVARTHWVAALGIAVMVLAGCVTMPPSEVRGTAAPAATPQVYSGRLALSVTPPPEATGGPVARSASGLFELVGTESLGRLTLTSPLGTTLAEARWSPQEAQLVSSEGERRFGSLDQLTTALVGEPLPIGALFAWLGGRPAAGASRALAEATGFEQFGWRVDLGRFTDGRLRLARDGSVRVELRLVLDKAPLP